MSQGKNVFILYAACRFSSSQSLLENCDAGKVGRNKTFDVSATALTGKRE